MHTSIVTLAATQPGLMIYLADAAHAFRPYPAHDDLLERATDTPFTLHAAPGETVALQLIAASDADCAVQSLAPLDMPEGTSFQCLSLEGIDRYGHPFVQQMPLEAGRPWALWCLVRFPKPGNYPLTLAYKDNLGREATLPITATIEGEPAQGRDLWDDARLARLQWLNSTAGLTDEIPSPFGPVSREGETLSIDGRKVLIGRDGLPAQICSYFTRDNSQLSAEGRPLLREPLAYEVWIGEHRAMLTPVRLTFTRETPAAVAWIGESQGEGLRLRVEGELAFDGTLMLRAQLRADSACQADVRFVHRPEATFARYFLGVGRQGGAMPEAHDWRWQRDVRQDACWSGSVNGGLMIKPRDEDMSQPLVNLYYRHGPRNWPAGWVNEGKGGFALRGGETPELTYFSGDITLDAHGRQFDMELMISPFKLVDHAKRFGTRYYHGGPYKEDRWPTHAKENGCTHLNIHHGNDSIPFINYPMFDPAAVKDVVDRAGALGISVQPYYTMRELSNHIPEFWALRSLRQEIFPKPKMAFDGIKGQGGTDDFVKQNLDGEVVPAWKHVFETGKYKGLADASIITDAMSRLSNFYVGGLEWMLTELGIGGVYLDDVAYDRSVARRMRRLFDKMKPEARMELHTWNHFEDYHGAAWGHNVLMYAELMPTLDSLWLGEGFDYDHSSADYLMVEVSGIPFGLMGEMLQDGGNAWRGLLFGMTSRFPYDYAEEKHPVHVWKLWDAFGLDHVEFTGFWEEDRPVCADASGVLCTSYYNPAKDRYLCCFAGFTGQPASFRPVLNISGEWTMRMPEITHMQSEKVIQPGELIPIAPEGGAVIWMERA